MTHLKYSTMKQTVTEGVFRMKLSIKACQPHMRDTWYQIYLHVGLVRVEIGSERPTRADCLHDAEQLVEEFAKEKIAVIHDEIY